MSLKPLVYPQVKRCVCVAEGRPEISRWWSPSVTTGNAATEACAPWKGAGTALALLRILVRRPCRDAKSVIVHLSLARISPNEHRPSNRDFLRQCPISNDK